MTKCAFTKVLWSNTINFQVRVVYLNIYIFGYLKLPLHHILDANIEVLLYNIELITVTDFMLNSKARTWKYMYTNFNSYFYNFVFSLPNYFQY